MYCWKFSTIFWFHCHHSQCRFLLLYVVNVLLSETIANILSHSTSVQTSSWKLLARFSGNCSNFLSKVFTFILIICFLALWADWRPGLGPTTSHLVLRLLKFLCASRKLLGLPTIVFRSDLHIFFKRYVYEVYLLFRDHSDSLTYLDYINKRHQNIKFTIEHECSYIL